MAVVIRAIRVLFSLYSLALVGRVFLQMLLGPDHEIVIVLQRITEPVLAPIRRYIPPVQSGGMAWDLAPMVAIILLWVIEWILVFLLSGLAA